MDRIELLDDHFVIRNRGAHRLLAIVGDVAIRYEAIASVVVHVKPGAAYGAIAVTLDDAELVAGELRRVLEA